MGSEERTTNPNRTVITVVTQNPTQKEKGDACLVVIYGDDLGRRIPLGAEPVILGRSSKCDVQLDQESVSRNHCRVSLVAKNYTIRDLGSTNGTYVNDEMVDELALRDGDQIKVGRTIMKFITGGNIEAQYHEEIYRLMTMDGLTGVHNKRYFGEMLEREVSRSMRYDRTFALFLIDIDHFKEVNDTMGHLAGDAVLRQLGAVVRNRMRRDDIVARIGGEEFAVLLPEVDATAGTEVAEDLRKMVESTPFRFESDTLHVTISIGVTAWKQGFATGDDIVKAADDKLYEAKRSGRNRVVV
jgi:two-component system cell cycle response regulator